MMTTVISSKEEIVTHRADVLIIGGGGAGTRAAIEVAERGKRALLVTKGQITHSGITPLAQTSYQAVFDPDDTLDLHFRDTLEGGRFLGDQNLIERMVEKGPHTVDDLYRYGVKIRKAHSGYFQRKLPGQSKPRSIYLSLGGYGMMVGLKNEILRHPNIEIYQDSIVTKIFQKHGVPIGAFFVDLPQGFTHFVQAKAIVIATGGCEELWDLTDTPPESVGDGIYLAFECGAELTDLEMMLFYPTVCVYPPALKGGVYPYETSLGPQYAKGALLNIEGKRVLPEEEPPIRDTLFHIMVKELREGRGTSHGGLILDISKSPKSQEEILSFLHDRTFYKFPKHFGIDITKDPIEVAPAAHYQLGGIQISERGETNVTGLYAAGECAGNIHGANRLTGNALLDTQVFGMEAGKAAADAADEREFYEPNNEELLTEQARVFAFMNKKSKPLSPAEVRKKIKGIIATYLGVPRDDKGIQKGLEQLHEVVDEDLPRINAPRIKKYNVAWQDALEVDFMAKVARLVSYAARFRTESRGHHCRGDYPKKDNANWLAHTELKLENEKIHLRKRAVVVTRYPFKGEEGSKGK
jgi:succinate dehydrogenase/fumarate reductase flavoprotein subunit